jgi:hypothetical protein
MDVAAAAAAAMAVESSSFMLHLSIHTQKTNNFSFLPSFLPFLFLAE